MRGDPIAERSSHVLVTRLDSLSRVVWFILGPVLQRSGTGPVSVHRLITLISIHQSTPGRGETANVCVVSLHMNVNVSLDTLRVNTVYNNESG